MKKKVNTNKPPKRRVEFFDRVQLPTDVVLGEAIVMVFENRSMQVQNVRGMLECTSQKVKLLTKRNRIEIIGQHLCVNEYSKDEIRIKGCIEQIVYLEKQR